MPTNKNSSKSNFRKKYVEGIIKKIKSGDVNIKTFPALCSVTDPYIKPDTTIDIIEDLKLLNMVRIEKDGTIICTM